VGEPRYLEIVLLAISQNPKHYAYGSGGFEHKPINVAVSHPIFVAVLQNKRSSLGLTMWFHTRRHGNLIVALEIIISTFALSVSPVKILRFAVILRQVVRIRAMCLN